MSFGFSQLRAGGQDVASGDIKLEVPHATPRKNHFYDDVCAVLRRKFNGETGEEREPRWVGLDMQTLFKINSKGTVTPGTDY